MPYTNAFIQELYRFRTLAPLGGPHKANANTELDGYIIPKGTQVCNTCFCYVFSLSDTWFILEENNQ